MSTYDCGSSSNDEYAVEILRRAIVEGDLDARVSLQQYLDKIVRSWLCQHPCREAACSLDNEDHYVALAFERFWQLAIDQQLEFNTFATVLPYLRLNLNGVILDMLRAPSRPKEVQFPEPDFMVKLQMEGKTSGTEVWGYLQGILHNVREQRLAYLLFHCGLRPREILHNYPQEFSDVCEIYRLRCNIMGRFLPNQDHL